MSGADHPTPAELLRRERIRLREIADATGYSIAMVWYVAHRMSRNQKIEAEVAHRLGLDAAALFPIAGAEE